MNDRPFSISVVTPVHGRADLVARLATSLTAAIAEYTRHGGEAEMLFIDSSEDDAARGIAHTARRHGATLVRSENDVRHKRNVGIERARGDIVLFVDSDCEADPHLLVEHANGHRVHEAPDGRRIAGVLGHVRLRGARTASWRAAEAAGFCDGFEFAVRYPQADWGPCANISYRREVLEEVGGFRESWPFRLGGDDVELGLRVNALGVAILCRPEAFVYHHRVTWARWSAVLERAWRWGRMDLHIRASIPSDRLRPAGAGPEIVLAVGIGVAVIRAFRRRSVDALMGVPVSIAAALLCEWRPRRPVFAETGGAVLRLVFATGTLVEAVRRGRPRLAFSGLHPVDHALAAARARRRSVSAAGWLLAAVCSGWVLDGTSRLNSSRHIQRDAA
jgi:glycosyltransferase involved in cell wall biosynthesis